MTAPLRARAVALPPGALKVGLLVFQTGNQADGGVTSITEIARELHAVAPIMFSISEGPADDRWASIGLRVVRVRRRRRARVRSISSIADALRLVAICRREKVAVLHCNDARAIQLAALTKAVLGTRILWNIRDVKPESARYGLKWVVRAVFADVVVVLSTDMANRLDSRLLSRVPSRLCPSLRVVSSAVRVPPALARITRSTARQDLGVPESSLLFVVVGAVRPKKRQLEFLEGTADLLLGEVPNAIVSFLGDVHPADAGYARACRARAAKSPYADRIRFEGYTNDPMLWYRAADVTVIASEYEGLARAMIESLAVGTPVVSTAVCSAEETLADAGGTVVPLDRFDLLAAACQRLAVDESLRALLAETGRTLALGRFDPSVVAREYEHLYQSLVERRWRAS